MHSIENDPMLIQNSIDKMSLKEKHQRLNGICNIMDTDEDGYLSNTEIETFLQAAQKDLMQHDQRSQWFSYDKNMDSFISWDEWKFTMNEFIENTEQEINETDEEKYDYDFRLFKAADVDKDNQLSDVEFQSYLHPQTFKHMHLFLAEEMKNLADEDQNDKIDIDEFLFMANPDPESGEYENDEVWIKEENENFAEFDVNESGFLELPEIEKWVASLNDIADFESIFDADGDGKLSISELVWEVDELIHKFQWAQMVLEIPEEKYQKYELPEGLKRVWEEDFSKEIGKDEEDIVEKKDEL